jgi:hypothetical protein
MGDCQIGTFVGLAAGSEPEAYFVTFSVHPISVEHAREAQEWSRW